MHRSVLEDPEFVAWANEHVVVLVGHPPGSHKTVDVKKPKPGEPKTQCSLYPGLSCDDHEQAFEDAVEPPKAGKDDKPPADGKAASDKPKAAKPKPKAKGKSELVLPKMSFDGVPASFVVPPEGTPELFKADREPKACREGLEAAQKALDEHPVLRSRWKAYEKAFADAEKAQKDGKVKVCLLALGKIDADAKDGLAKPVAERLKAVLDAIQAKVAPKVASATAGSGAPAVKAKALLALRAELDVPLSTPLPALAEIDAWLAANAPEAVPPAAPAK